MYEFEENLSIFYGTCFTVCPLRQLKAEEFVIIGLQRKLDLTIYIHRKSETQFANSKVQPLELKAINVDIAAPTNIDVLEIDFAIGEKKFT